MSQGSKLLILGILFFFGWLTRAQEFTSTSYKVLDPVLEPGGFSTSNDYRLWSVLAQPAIGTSTATSFSAKAGFLYFPEPSSGSGVTVTTGGSTGSSSGSSSSLLGLRVELSGLAYPNRPVIIFQSGRRLGETKADAVGNFSFSLNTATPGTSVFGVYAIDVNNIQSRTLTFPVTATPGVVARAVGIFIPPTITTDKSEVKTGEEIKLFGQGPAQAMVEVEAINGRQTSRTQVLTDSNGNYNYSLSTKGLTLGDYASRARSIVIGGSTSLFGLLTDWTVGPETILRKPATRCPRTADLNDDCLVNLYDFSILTYWLDRPNPPLKVDLERNQTIDLRDFSVAAYYWTG
ncbi:MAG: hypothetical protein AAB455_01770 [Patescibacteria group bacterium]